MALSFESSQRTHERAVKSLVGGVNSPVRSFKRVGGAPILAKRGEGPWIYDVDGHRYVDLVMSYGPHLYGHGEKSVIEAVRKSLDGSTCFGMTSEGEVEWAERVLARLPGAEKVRAVSTGTEACATAVRLARGITGRDVLVKFSGHYHGHVDSLMFDSGSGLATLSEAPEPESKGVPAALGKLVRILPFNDLAAAQALFAQMGSEIAGVILEPIMGNMGVVPPQPGFLQGLRDLCTKHQSILIFDEVMTGLRVGKTSAQGRYDIRPDLTTLGKIVGGGFALAAVAGPAKYMDTLAPLGPVYQAGTLSGNPVSIAGGLAMLNLIDRDDPYAKLEAIGADFEAAFTAAAKEKGVALRMERVGSMVSFYFRSGVVKNANDCRDVNFDVFNKFFRAMLEEGFMMPPSPFEACFLSVAHGQLEKGYFHDKARRVFARL